MTFDLRHSTLPADTCHASSRAFLPAIRLIGSAARDVLREGAAGQVIAVFRRSLYVAEEQGGLCCVGDESIGPGPLNGLFAAPSGRLGEKGRLAVGDDFRVGGGTFFLGGVPAFRLDTADEWWPAEVAAGWSAASLLRGIAHLAALAAFRAPRDGFGGLIKNLLLPWPQIGSLVGSPVLRKAAPSIASLAGWLELAIGSRVGTSAIPATTADLVGLGPGLTPSGDDFLGGMLIALSALDQGEVQRVLAAWLMPVSAVRTGTISRAHLSCACRGQGAEAVHVSLAALVAGDRSALDAAVTRIDVLGHSSGWDALAGVAVVCVAWLRAMAGTGASSAARN